MKRAFQAKLSRPGESATYQLWFSENEHPEPVIRSGDYTRFIRKDGSEITFEGVHMDRLAQTVKDWSEEIGAEGSLEETTRNLPDAGR